MSAHPSQRSSTKTSPIRAISALGQSVWYDSIRRSLLTSGDFERMVREDGLSGVTSNPSIFEKAIVGSTDYDDALATSRSQLHGPATAAEVKSAYEELAMADLRQAADLLHDTYDQTDAADGYVSMEVAPDLAHDTDATIAEAQRLWAAVDRPNLMIKVPGTPEGLPAIRKLIGQGINVNITLLFSTKVYEQVVEAYLSGLEDRLAGGAKIDHLASVASFFISRIDSAVDPKVSKSLQGKVGIASGKVAYARFTELFASERWHALKAHGAQTQRILWASTSTKNPAFSDVYYVESLIGADTVDTVPPATYEAFNAHGTARVTLTDDVPAARAVLDDLTEEGVDLDEATDALVREGVEKFMAAQSKLLASVEESLKQPTETRPLTMTRSLPAELEDRVKAIVEEWGRSGKVARLWGRDAGLWTGADEANWLGWLTVPMDQASHAHRFAAVIDDIHSSGFTHAVVLGMGGSSLCVDVLSHTFPTMEGFPQLRVLDSTDPQQISALEAELDLSKTLFFVSSKSGTTLEPNIFAAYFRALVSEQLDDKEAGRHFIAITDPGTALEQLAERENFRAVFHGWPTIGGRYSALSDFGMIPAAVAGIDVVEFLDRAERMAHACAASIPASDNPGLQLGAVIGACATSGRDKVTLVASPSVLSLGGWLEQLLAESTGKQGKGVIPVDLEQLGAPEVYGADRVFVYLSLGSDSDVEQEAKITALEEVGYPVVRITLDDIADLGGEFFRWEFATAVAGSIIGINPFNQPDVEEAKVAARKLTDAYDASGSMPESEWFSAGDGLRLSADEGNTATIKAAARTGATLEDYLSAHLHRLEPGDYLAQLAYLPMTAENEGILGEIRVLIRDRLRVATCVGFGPRFQHSTGQTYKGGPNSGVFLQLTCQDTIELAVPEHKYSFAVVKEAQARGDFDALVHAGRRALRIDVGSDVRKGMTALRDAIERVLTEK